MKFIECDKYSINLEQVTYIEFDNGRVLVYFTGPGPYIDAPADDMTPLITALRHSRLRIARAKKRGADE